MGTTKSSMVQLQEVLLRSENELEDTGDLSSLVAEIEAAGEIVPDALEQRVIQELKRFWPESTELERARAAQRSKAHGTLGVVLWVASVAPGGAGLRGALGARAYSPGPLLNRARANLRVWWPTTMSEHQANLALWFEVIELSSRSLKLTPVDGGSRGWRLYTSPEGWRLYTADAVFVTDHPYFWSQDPWVAWVAPATS